jgi:hypothetical protein
MDQILLKNKINQIKRARAWQQFRPVLVMAGQVTAGLIGAALVYVLILEFLTLNIILNTK